jgi:isopropylmalate/homocitrate/citramalate synthase
MPERANISGSIIEQPVLSRLIQESKGSAKDSRKRTANLSITLERVINVLKKNNYDEDTKKELIKIASRTPQGGLERFMASISIHVNAIQRNRRGEEAIKTEAIISHRRQQSIQEVEQNKLMKEKTIKKDETFFADTEEQIKTVKQLEIVKPPVQSVLPQKLAPSREEVVEAMESRRAFAKRLEELNDDDSTDKEWLK